MFSHKRVKCLLRHLIAVIVKIQRLWETPICTFEEQKIFATMLATVDAIIWTTKGPGKSG